jgi:hypothetical protein
MGCYVRFSLDITLKADTPKEVIDILNHALPRRFTKPKKVELPDHKFFKSPDWRFTLGCNNDLETPRLRKLRGKNKGYSLNISSEFKENWGSEYKFMSWIDLYLDHLPEEVLGWREDDYNERNLIKKK